MKLLEFVNDNEYTLDIIFLGSRSFINRWLVNLYTGRRDAPSFNSYGYTIFGALNGLCKEISGQNYQVVIPGGDHNGQQTIKIIEMPILTIEPQDILDENMWITRLNGRRLEVV